MAMSVPQAQQWMSKISNPGKFGWKNELKKSQTAILREQKSHFKDHKSPSGELWKKTKSKKLKKGDVAPIAKDERPGSAMKGRYFVRKIRSAQEKRMVNKRKMGSKKALYRTGKDKRTALMKGATKRTDSGHFMQLSTTSIVFGPRRRLHPGKHQYGDPSNNVPQRKFYGVSTQTAQNVSEIFRQGYMKRIAKLAP